MTKYDFENILRKFIFNHRDSLYSNVKSKSYPFLQKHFLILQLMMFYLISTLFIHTKEA